VGDTGANGKRSAESSAAPVLDQEAALAMLRGSDDEAGQRDSSIRSSSSAYNPTVPLSAVKLPVSQEGEQPTEGGSKLSLLLILLGLLFVVAAGVTIAGLYLF